MSGELVERIARALAENFDGPNGSMLLYVPHAKVAARFINAEIAAERERCAGVAEWCNPGSTEYQRGRSDAAAAIRRPERWLNIG